MTVPLSRARGVRALLVVALVAMLGACDPDVAEPQPSATGGDAGAVDGANGGGGDAGAADGTTDGGSGDAGGGDGSGGGEQPAPAPADGFSLTLPGGASALVEGGEAVVLDVGVVRAPANDRPVTLAVEDDLGGFAWTFGSTRLEPGQGGTTLSVTLPIAALPRQPGTRTLRLVATDGSGARVDGEIAFAITPTARPDIYLLAGQSNMVGSTEPDARRAFPGGPDQPDPRIFQLNATDNEASRFPTPAAYTDTGLIADPERTIVTALDPLHNRNSGGDDPKSRGEIGLGLTFAKQALADTTADIVLVPAAWSDTGFCRRESGARLDFAAGWNPSPPASAAFAGTLLHDRAIARTNLAIAETGGILRGILWHQGEADSEDEPCALAYAENLRRMVESLRSNIAPDARGPSARGADARIPFIVGTMSRGDSGAGGADYTSYSETKARVDAAHRDVASIVPLSAFVNADDLVPPAYPCGQGDCIHFGAAALRELGRRYYDALRGLFRTP